MGNQLSQENVVAPEPSPSPSSQSQGGHEDSVLALCPRVLDNKGFLGKLNSELRQLGDAKSFVKEFRSNAKIVEEALELFAAQAPSLFVEACSQSSVICDCRLPDIPIVWCNDFFERLSLYPKEMIIGRNCRFLQGPLTDQETVTKVRMAVRNKTPCDVDILNYRRDGVPFWNRFSLFPIFDKEGIRYFFSIQRSIMVENFHEIPFREWTCVEVALFLREIGMDQFAPSFYREDIVGEVLTELTRADLKQLGIVYRSDKGKFRKAVRDLVKTQSSPNPGCEPFTQENLRTIKMYYKGSPYVIVVNLAHLTIFELEEAASRLYGVEVLRLGYSSATYKYLLQNCSESVNEEVSKKVRDLEAMKHIEIGSRISGIVPEKGLSAIDFVMVENPVTAVNVESHASKKESEKKSQKYSRSFRRVLTRKSDQKSETPNLLLDAPLSFRSVAEIAMDDLIEIGTTAQLIDLLTPLNEHTFVIHTVESDDRDLMLLRYSDALDESFVPMLLISHSHIILKANSAAAKMFEMNSPKHMVGLRVSHFFTNIYKQKSNKMSLVLSTQSNERRLFGEEEEEIKHVFGELTSVCGNCYLLKFIWDDEPSCEPAPPPAPDLSSTSSSSE